MLFIFLGGKKKKEKEKTTGNILVFKNVTFYVKKYNI